MNKSKEIARSFQNDGRTKKQCYNLAVDYLINWGELSRQLAGSRHVVTIAFRILCKKYNCSVYINCHAVTQALRNLDGEGYPVAPNKADTEGRKICQ